jgi:lipopolysaccharide export LptBFGC system permease protein LptF
MRWNCKTGVLQSAPYYNFTYLKVRPMPSTLVRYFLKRWGLQILAGFAFFGGLLIAWEVKSISDVIFEQHGSIRKLIPLLLTTIPWNVGLILPMTAVLGGLLGTQHLSEGSELVASQGLGHGMRGFLKPWGLLSLILVVCSVANAHWVSPRASRMEIGLLYDMAQEAALTGGYMPRVGEEPKLIRGNVFSRGSGEDAKGAAPFQGQTIYWGRSKKDGRLHIMQIGSETVSHLISDTYSYKVEKVKLDQQDAFEQIRLTFRFEDVNGKAVNRDAAANQRFTDMSYKVFEVSQPIQINKKAFYLPTTMRHLDTGELLAIVGDAREAKGLAGVELSRRFSTPLACCALLLLGIAMGLSHPRFYRGGALVKSIALILAYIIAVRVVEGWIENSAIHWVCASALLPLLFFAAGWLLLYRKMYPTRHGRGRLANLLSAFLNGAGRHDFVSRVKKIGRHILPATVRAVFRKRRHSGPEQKIIGRWTAKKWWANFGGVLGIFMLFHVFIEFSGLASFIATGGGRLWLFVKYWACNLPVSLPFVLPIVFLLAWALTFSDATVSREWTALRTGGVSLVKWICASWKAWGAATIAVFLMGAYISPNAYATQNRYYWQIKNNEDQTAKREAAPSAGETPTTLFLGSTGVFWYSEESGRWGFPLLPPASSPSLIFWEHGHASTRQINWDGDGWVQGADAETLFPASPLRQYRKADEIPTSALFVWQAWAPSPARGTLLWGRLLRWLAGPCLFFAALGYLFPPPRSGRGLTLGYALVLSLAFMWMQNLFEGASKAGQIPPLWGVLAPMLILVGFGLANLRRLRT